MLDEATGRGLFVDHHALSEYLGVPVVPVCALDGRGIKELAKKIQHARPAPPGAAIAASPGAAVGRLCGVRLGDLGRRPARPAGSPCRVADGPEIAPPVGAEARRLGGQSGRLRAPTSVLDSAGQCSGPSHRRLGTSVAHRRHHLSDGGRGGGQVPVPACRPGYCASGGAHFVVGRTRPARGFSGWAARRAHPGAVQCHRDRAAHPGDLLSAVLCAGRDRLFPTADRAVRPIAEGGGAQREGGSCP
jgi:hypothetical protein